MTHIFGIIYPSNLKRLTLFYPLKHYDLVILYTKAKLEAESERTYLGYVWWILDPLVGVFIYYLLFKVFMNRGGDDYIPFLFLGLSTWKWFESTVSKSTMSILGSAGIFKKVNIHKSLFPTVDVFYNTWKFLVVMALTLVVYFGLGYSRSSHVLAIPIILLVEFILIYGLSIFISSITPFLPDLKFLVGYSMRLLFYPSGILFDISRIPEKYKIFVKLNFFSGIVESFRNVMMYNKEPNWPGLIYALSLGLVSGVIGYLIINKQDKIYPKIC